MKNALLSRLPLARSEEIRAKPQAIRTQSEDPKSPAKRSTPSSVGAKLGISSRLRTAIALLMLIPVVVPLVAVALLWLNEIEARSAASERVATSARLAQAHIRPFFANTLERLHEIDDSLGPDPEAFNLSNLPSISDGVLFGLYDAQGLTISRDGTRGASVASNAEFQALAAGRSWAVTPLIVQNGLRFFGIGRRIEREGRFAGVVTAYVQAGFLSDLWGSLSLGPDSTVTLIRDDGWLVTRYPLPQRGVANLAGSELFTQELPARGAGVFQPGASPIDGKQRIVGYEKIEELGVVVLASMSRTMVSDAFWSRARTTASVSAPAFIALIIVCGALALLSIRQERSRVALEFSLEQNRMLLQEIHHRVKNNLQTVAAMVRLQPAPQTMKDELAARIAAVVSIHQHIYETDQFGAVDSEGYLSKLLTGLQQSAPPDIEVSWRLAAINLSPAQASPLGLIVNELVLNAFKHAFPRGRRGSVRVELRLEGDVATLTVADDGVGSSTSEAGFGTRLLRGFAIQLGGTLSNRVEDGFASEVSFPVRPT